MNDEPIPAEEYLERERAAPQERHEYIDGWVVRVSGASIEHNFIVSNLNRELGNQLRETDCRVTTNDLRVTFPSLDKYAYPDVVAFCGEPELEEEHLDMLYNPTLIVEVLSPTTEDYDHGKKFSRYRRIDTLQEYLLVAQDAPHVEHYVRQDDGSWRLTDTDGLDATITLPSIEAELPLDEVYLDVLEDEESFRAE
ncbi:Uma2 family endonuclease [Salinibacter ruber]|uniref:Uma2 family endonuclease n=1 Tax=Salinibacter ruber TaxID=146919 RepID=A0A9X2ZXR6_9BACT|nr:Uma2 family endonuclease [Salinibacter ruber]MBB4089722.1 Uma2 family endonuclease [Salinibacter ruber]MCS3610222.1 Uma2 family endonuclease [Salinibacter ruber]MCS3614841.1 Uma2 family endonuclease [Salinibacter ruber]MCS3647721.1 Uma2 family endonuclease [Salinibacter ruber]MCS3673763.1 Uma2 family endonuclease [Salinibacter ruber]